MKNSNIFIKHIECLTLQNLLGKEGFGIRINTAAYLYPWNMYMKKKLISGINQGLMQLLISPYFTARRLIHNKSDTLSPKPKRITDRPTESQNPSPYVMQFFFSEIIYEGWNFNSGNYLFTTDTK